MVRWTLGESDIEVLISSGELQKLTGDAGSGERLLKKAGVTLETARSAIERRSGIWSPAVPEWAARTIGC